MDILRRRFYMAVTRCTGEHAVKPRLAEAWIEHLDTIKTEQLPEYVQNDFKILRVAMYAHAPMSGEHTARASVRKMSQKQAAAHTLRIADIFRELMNVQFAETIRAAEAQVNPTAEAGFSPQTETLLN
jgi:hypothetical protein